MLRLRLVIPAAIAAFATYAALVRDEMLLGAPTWSPATTPDGTGTPLGESVIAPPPARPGPAVVTERLPVRPARPAAPSPDTDLMPLVTSPALTTPSVYDLLAGPPPDAEPAPEPPPQVADEPAPVDPGALFDVPAPAESAPVLDEEPLPEPHASIHQIPVQANPVPALRAVDAGDPWQIVLDEGRFALGGWAASAGHSLVSAVTFRRRLPDDVGPDQIVLEVDASENVPDGGLTVLSDPGFAPDRDGFTILLQAAESGPFSAAGGYRVLPPA